jgi:hypothetical protein
MISRCSFLQMSPFLLFSLWYQHFQPVLHLHFSWFLYWYVSVCNCTIYWSNFILNTLRTSLIRQLFTISIPTFHLYLCLSEIIIIVSILYFVLEFFISYHFALPEFQDSPCINYFYDCTIFYQENILQFALS